MPEALQLSDMKPEIEVPGVGMISLLRNQGDPAADIVSANPCKILDLAGPDSLGRTLVESQVVEVSLRTIFGRNAVPALPETADVLAGLKNRYKYFFTHALLN